MVFLNSTWNERTYNDLSFQLKTSFTNENWMRTSWLNVGHLSMFPFSRLTIIRKKPKNMRFFIMMIINQTNEKPRGGSRFYHMLYQKQNRLKTVKTETNKQFAHSLGRCWGSEGPISLHNDGYVKHNITRALARPNGLYIFKILFKH